MKTIVTPNKFQCEVCGFFYADAEMAIACEAQNPELVEHFGKFNIGDHVWVRTRYDGWFLDKVVKTKIFPNKVYFNKVFNSVVEESCAKSYHHKIEVATANEWEVDKDGYCSNWWDSSEIIKDTDIAWQTGDIPEDIDVYAAFQSSNGLNCKYITPTENQRLNIVKWAGITEQLRAALHYVI